MIMLGRHEIAVWYRRTASITEEDLRQVVEVLSSDEQARCDRFRTFPLRRDFGAAHHLLRMALSTYAQRDPKDWQFGRDLLGRPVVVSPRNGDIPAFSLTHTDGVVACALADVPVGIDVERCDRPPQSVEALTDYLSQLEIEELSRCFEADRNTRLMELWTLKEACAKVLGEGLSRSFRSISISFDDSADLIPSDSDRGNWQLWVVALDRRWRIALAVNASMPRDHRQLIFHDAAAEHSARTPPAELLHSGLEMYTGRPSIRNVSI